MGRLSLPNRLVPTEFFAIPTPLHIDTHRRCQKNDVLALLDGPCFLSPAKVSRTSAFEFLDYELEFIFTTTTTTLLVHQLIKILKMNAR